MSNTDIRAWAREKGLDVNARGPVNKAVVELYEAENVAEGMVFDPESPSAELPPQPATKGEQTPEVAGAGWRGKLRRDKSTAVKPARGKRRVSLETLGGAGWQVLANVMGGTGFVPAARVMAMQSPVAGLVLEDALKGTMADRLLQPLARAGDKAGDLGALFGPIALVTVIQKNPALYPTLKPVLTEMLWRWVDIAGPKMAELEKRREKRAAMAGDLDVEGMLAMIFAPTPEQQAAEQDE